MVVMASLASHETDESESDGKSRAPVLSPSPALRLPSQPSEGRRKSRGKTPGQWEFHGPTMDENKQQVFTHGVHFLHHFPCDSPVRYMMYSEDAAAFVSLHINNTAHLYQADGHQLRSQAWSVPCPFTGLTSTKLPGHLVAWGPGENLVLLDSEFHYLDVAHEPLDIRVCQAAEHSTEVVTAGAGNVCVWSVRHMSCKMKILEGLHQSVFTQMALAPPTSSKPHRAFAVCGRVVTVVDLSAGKVLEHKTDLCLRNITALVFCAQVDCLIIASQDLSIRVWDQDWELRMAFVGHNGVVKSLLYCTEFGMLISASMDCTLRCWDVEKGDEVQCVHTEDNSPPLFIGGPGKEGIFYSFSHHGVDFWTMNTLYTLHCKLRGDARLPLRQVLVPPFPAPYPTRALCVSGDSDVMLVAAETGAVLTSFMTKQRILCADYCLHKEVLLVLTEAGTVLQANTLTNPVTLMEEWQGRGLGPWQSEGGMTRAQNLPNPGPACCLVLYSCIVETQRALKEWQSLQEERGHSHRKQATLDDAKNKFLVMLGQSGGCVSVLRLSNGKVLYRTPAHNSQRVTAMQAHPENSYLLTTGEDKSVLVWKVNVYIQECLSQHLSVCCSQPLLHLAMLGPQLALALQDPQNVTYNLMHFSLLNQSRTDHPPGESHFDCITGLCVCPELRMFISCSLDGTVHIWNEENRLIRTLQLSAEPECMAYSGLRAELFLGIKGDLYRMNCARFLPHDYQEMLHCAPNYDHVIDLPIQIKAKRSKQKTAAKTIKEKNGKNIIITDRNPLFSENMWRQKEYESLLARDEDLAALLQGTVMCKRRKPPSTEQTRKEAFERYMKIVYGMPHNIKFEFGDMFDPDELAFFPEPLDDESCTALDLHGKQDKPQTVETSKEEEPVPAQCNVADFKSKTVLIEKSWHDLVPSQPFPKQSLRAKDNQILKEEPPQRPPSPREQPEPKKLAPPPFSPRTPAPVPPRTPTPEMPGFLKQFAEEGWFRDMYPHRRSIPTTLSPDDFSLQLLDYLNNCSAPFKIKIVAVLQALHSQGLLKKTDMFYKGLIDSVPRHISANMSPGEQSLISEILHLLVCLKSDSCDLVRSLLTLLAYNKYLWKKVLSILTEIGVHEAEQWLCPELESWDSELLDQSDVWKSLHERVEFWLELWTSKYKEHSRCQDLKSLAQWKPLTFTMVDVLNYFCSTQKEEYIKATHVAPTGRKDTVLLPQFDCSSQAIHRLGENYSLARIRRPPGIFLPPLRNRPFLMCFPKFITLPLPRISLRPFHIHSDQSWPRASPRHYFILQQSYVEYYR